MIRDWPKWIVVENNLRKKEAIEEYQKLIKRGCNRKDLMLVEDKSELAETDCQFEVNNVCNNSKVGEE